MSKPPRKPPAGPSEDDFDYEALFQDESLRGRRNVVDYLSSAKLKRFGIPLAILVVVLLIANVVRHQFDPAGSAGPQVSVRIPVGTSTAGLAKLLDQNGVVPSATAFRIWAKIDGGVEFQAGEYAFHKNESVGAAIAVLANGPKKSTDRLTIPEGFRLKQIADRVGQLPGMSSQKFLDAVTDGSIRSDFQPPDSTNLEGLLFPDTYLLSSSDTEKTLAQRMVNEFDAVARVNGLDNAPGAVGHTPYETLIIASLIEAEAKVPDDRGKMSQVIENRLFKAMPLQIDATVLYALNNPSRKLSNSDLKVESRYNTYLHKDLPPAPINSPGLASIKAALAPTPGPWLYWVLTGSDGSSSFAETLAEHNKNVQLARSRGLL